jgi:hypothetical protein
MTVPAMVPAIKPAVGLAMRALPRQIAQTRQLKKEEHMRIVMEQKQHAVEDVMKYWAAKGIEPRGKPLGRMELEYLNIPACYVCAARRRLQHRKTYHYRSSVYPERR